MTFEIGLLPSGHLHCYSDDEQGESGALRKAFSKDPAEGLFTLAADKGARRLPPGLRYWHDFASEYLSARCQSQDVATTPQTTLPLEAKKATPEPTVSLSAEQAERFRQAAPPMRGGEYLDGEVLQSIWTQLDSWVRRQADALGSLTALLNERAPQWHPVGRVCFHLAENKRDPDYPFAFMVTYAPEQRPSGQVRYQPLHNALQEYAGMHDKQTLIRLLSPVHLAAQSSPMIEELVESGDIYHPLAWTPEEAYQFLREIPLYEESGLVVRLPDWWRKRSRPQVGVKIGGRKGNSFGADQLLDFRVQVVIGDEPLTEEELEALLHAEAGLVFLKGRWVEVDRAQLAQALNHWKAVEAEAQRNGLGFAEGMRLLAGAPARMGRAADDELVREWSLVEPGDWLKELLEKLRTPAAIQAAKPGKALKTSLRPYQEEGVSWLWLLSQLGLGACLADDMGLGKTIQVIALLLLLRKQPPADRPRKPSLLVLPASLLANWQVELSRFAPSLRSCFIHGSLLSSQQIDALEQAPQTHLSGYDLVLTTYGTLKRRPWLQQLEWRLLVLDEAQAIKNPATSQTKMVKQVKAEARIALTGTPIENDLGDLWSLFDFLNPGLLGSSSRFKDFVKSLAERSQDQYAPLRKLTQPYILRRLKTDKRIITDLPEKSEVEAWCGLSKTQAAQYQRAVKELQRGLETLDGMQRRGLVLSYLQRFKQICNHPSQLLGDGQYAPTKSGKFQRLASLCEEIAARQEKLLLFTQFREITAPLAEFLASQFGRPGLVLHGGTPVKQRQQLVQQFQSEEGPPFFVLSLKAGGTGLTLTRASHVIHFDRWWNPAVENQATDRAFRIGQKKNVLVHKFICRGTVEERIDAMIREKTALADDLLQGGAEIPLTELDNEALINLVSLDIDKTLIG